MTNAASVSLSGRSHPPRAIAIRRAERGYVLEAEVWLPRPVEDVFPFFADAGNLEILTPSFLRFEVLTPRPVDMGVGTRIDYRLRVHAIPIRWQSAITCWDPPYRFVDEMLRGPYRRWHHEHTFEAIDGGTLVRDRVQYAAPGGALVHALMVGRDVRKIFTYRQDKLQTLFPADGAGTPGA